MKVLLLKPYNRSDHIQPSLGLGYLATAIRDKHEVTILDGIKRGMTIKKLKEYLADYQPDVFGCQCYTFDLDYVTKAMTVVKRQDPKVITIIGGPHPSALPHETMSRLGDSLDFAMVGEAEKGLPMLLEVLSSKNNPITLDAIPGLVWRDKGQIRVNPQVFINDLDSLGFPSWDLIKPNEYPEAQHGAFFKQFPIAPIITTRGCPYSCTFCAAKLITGIKMRRRSVAHVLAEIKMLYRDYGIREIHIVDDNFTQDKRFAKELLTKFIDLHLGISLAFPNGVRLETLDSELLQLMKGAGCYLVSVGIESGSDRILRLMRKNLSTGEIREKMRVIRQAGLDAAGFFILGYPGETVEEIQQTIAFSLELDLLRANYFNLLPLPGTEIYGELRKDGKLSQVDWEHFSFSSAPYIPEGLTRPQLKGLQRQAFLRFFLRPRILLENLRGIKSLKHLRFLVIRAFRWLL
jgi:radical SAM superfamily enzyme YgiQ (UPF0313 family)